MLVIDSEELNGQLRAAMEYYQKSAEPAVLKNGEMEKLFAREVPIAIRLQRWIIKILDPYLRFLLQSLLNRSADPIYRAFCLYMVGTQIRKEVYFLFRNILEKLLALAIDEC